MIITMLTFLCAACGLDAAANHTHTSRGRQGRHKQRNNNTSTLHAADPLFIGAVFMLVSNWTAERPQRKCHFNASMDALASKWKPHNNYPVILMDTKPWSRQDMVDIRRTWSTMDLKFINIARIFESQPDILKSQFLDAKKPLATLSYKRMCHFFFKGFTEVRLLMEYRYLLRLDDDTCLLDHINYDIFEYLHHKRAAYAYSHIWYDYEKVTKGMYKFTDEYVATNQLQWQNPTLHNATVTAKSFPKVVPCFNTNFEVLNTVRYRDPAVMQYVDAVVASRNIFHRRWGDAPLRYPQVMLFWRENELVRLSDFEINHSSWDTLHMTEHPASGNPELFL